MTVAAATVCSSLRVTEGGLTREYRGDRGGQRTLFITALIGLMHTDRQDAFAERLSFSIWLPQKDSRRVNHSRDYNHFTLILMMFVGFTNSNFCKIFKSLYLNIFILNIIFH